MRIVHILCPWRHQGLIIFPVILITVFFLWHFKALPNWNSHSLSFDSPENKLGQENTIVIYNRIPKTGSTSLMHLPYELCSVNQFNVLLLIITGSSTHSMTFNDQIFFANNITRWREKHPAIYHGHFAFIDLYKLVDDKSKNIVHINMIRKPIDRLVSYYYFLRYGDDYRVNKIRSRMGDKVTFDECVKNKQLDCDPKKMWLQVPWFCGHNIRCWEPGNAWALEQAKNNLVNKYFLVGLTEDLESFVDILESTLPRFFTGAGKMFRSSDKLSHIRRTIHKDPISEESVKKLESSRVWKMENDFYLFAEAQFNEVKANFRETQPGKNYFHYEKIKPR